MVKPPVGVIGASSMLGAYALDRLGRSGTEVIAFSRKLRMPAAVTGVTWRMLGWPAEGSDPPQVIPHWLCLCAVWVLPEHFKMMKALGARRIVALSSTSRFTKTAMNASTDVHENALAQQLIQGERQLQAWCEANGIEWVILRPTLIYDFVHDKNISHIATFIRRYRFFPILRGAVGRRQPVHAAEVAYAACSALVLVGAANKEYNISGGETLTYRDMVERIFALLGFKPRFINIPIWGFRVAVFIAKLLPKYRHLSSAMAERMTADLVFDNSNAMVDLGYAPDKFPVHALKAK